MTFLPQPPTPAAAARRRTVLTTFVVLGLWGLATHGTHAGSGDEPHYVAIAHSLAFDLDLDLSNNYGAAEPLIGSGTLLPGNHVRQGRGGVARPVHDVGLPLLLAPYVRIVRPMVVPLLAAPDHPLLRRLRLSPSTAYRHLLSAIMIVVAAVLARQMFTVFLVLGASLAVAFWTALLVAMSPPLLIFSILTFTELTSALLCLVVFRRVALDTAASTPAWLLTGAAAGALLLIHIRNIGLVLPLAVLACLALRRQRSVSHALAFFVPLSLLVAIRTAVNHAFWGTYITNPHARPGVWSGWSDTAAVAANRLGGMFLDQEFGLLPYAPVFLLAIYGGVVLLRVRRALPWQLAAVIGGYLLLLCLPITNAHGWTGGWNPAARFLTPVVPLLALPLCAALSRGRAIVVLVVALQIAISAYMWQHPKDLWNDGDGVAAVCERGVASGCEYLPSFPER